MDQFFVNPYQPPAPWNPMQTPFGRTPMQAGWGGPNIISPFNLDVHGMLGGGPMGVAAQMFSPMLMQGFLGPNMMPSQIFPTQNIWDQMQSRQYFMNTMQTSKIAAAQDAGQLRSIAEGIMRMFKRRELLPQEQIQAQTMGQDIAGMLPYAEAFVGPENVDAIFGVRGSSSVMARQMYQAMYTSMDPVTGAIGASPTSVGNIAQHVWQGFYGKGANLSRMKGITAGQVGTLYREAQTRGWMGGGLGLLDTPEERYREARETLAPERMSDGDIRRIAMGTDTGRRLEADFAARNEAVPEARLKALDQRVMEAAQKIKGGAPADELKPLSDVTGGVLQYSEAERIKQRLSNLTGVVSAMRDIFGDMGHPNAPMRELLNGLDALTQGGMATMNPADVEKMVRGSYNLAKQSGLGMQGYLGLLGQGGGIGDQMGLDRSLIPGLTQGTAAYAAAVRNIGVDPAWGNQSTEQLILQDQRKRIASAASPMGNRLAALARAHRDTLITNRASEAYAMAESMKNGQLTYDFNGKKNLNVYETTDENGLPRLRNHMDMINLMQEGGMTGSTVYDYLNDTFANQELFRNQRLDRVMMHAQRAERRQAIMGGAVETLARAESLQTGNVGRAIGAMSAGDQRLFRERAGAAFAERFFQMPDAVANNDRKAQQFMGKAMRESIIAAYKQMNPTAPDTLFADLNPQAFEKTFNELAGSVQSNIGQHLAWSTGGAMRGWRQGRTAESNTALRMAEREEERSEIDTKIAISLSGLGQAGFVSRLSDAVRAGRTDTNFTDIIKAAMGGVDMTKIAEAHPQIQELQRQLDLMQQGRAMRGPTGDITDAGNQLINWATTNASALIHGEEEAAARAAVLREEAKNLQKTGGSKEQIDSVNKAIAGLDLAAQTNSGITAVVGALGVNMNAKYDWKDAETQLKTLRALGHDQRAASTVDQKKGLKQLTISTADLMRAQGETLLNDRASMLQLGRGGVSLVQDILAKAEALGKVDPNSAEARALQVASMELFEQVNARVTDKAPGQPGRKFPEMGPKELSDYGLAQAASDWRKQMRSGPEQAKAAAEEQAAALTARLVERYGKGAGGKDLGLGAGPLQEMLAGNLDRMRLQSAIIALDTAADFATVDTSGVQQMRVGGKLKNIAALTGDELNQALLERRKELTGKELEQYDAKLTESKALREMVPGDYDSMRKAMEQYRLPPTAAAPAPGAGAATTVNVKTQVTGELRMTGVDKCFANMSMDIPLSFGDKLVAVPLGPHV